MHVHVCLPRSTFKDFKLVASKWPLWEHFCHKVLPTLQIGPLPSGQHPAKVPQLFCGVPYRAHPTKGESLPEAGEENLLARTANLLGGFLRHSSPEHRAPHRIRPHIAKQTPGHLPSLHKIANGPKMSEIGDQSSLVPHNLLFSEVTSPCPTVCPALLGYPQGFCPPILHTSYNPSTVWARAEKIVAASRSCQITLFDRRRAFEDLAK